MGCSVIVAITSREHLHWIPYYPFLPPAMKLRKGNVFTSVSRILSTGGGACMARGHAWQGACMAEMSVDGRGHVWWGGHRRRCACPPPILWDAVNERAVRILLECILVCDKNSQSQSYSMNNPLRNGLSKAGNQYLVVVIEELTN